MSDTDYISRVACLEAIQERIEQIGYEDNPHVLSIRQSIRDLPAADVRPVVRGKWVNYGDEYRPDIKCCMCGQRKPILLGNFNFNFCPNCGADMREES